MPKLFKMAVADVPNHNKLAVLLFHLTMAVSMHLFLMQSLDAAVAQEVPFATGQHYEEPIFSTPESGTPQPYAAVLVPTDIHHSLREPSSWSDDVSPGLSTAGFDATAHSLLRSLPPPVALLLRGHVQRLLARRDRWRRRVSHAMPLIDNDAVSDEVPSSSNDNDGGGQSEAARDASSNEPPPLTSFDLLASLRHSFPFNYELTSMPPLSGTMASTNGRQDHGVTPLSAWAWRERVRRMQWHAYSGYVAHAWPADELRPLTCDGRRWNARERGTLDDVLGGYALTLVDSLDSLAVTGDLTGFRAAVSAVIHHVRLDTPVSVSVFEASIRVLGGLLSAHQLASSADDNDRYRLWDTEAHCGPALGWRERAADTLAANATSGSGSDLDIKSSREAFYAYLASNATARDICGRLLCGCGRIRPYNSLLPSDTLVSSDSSSVASSERKLAHRESHHHPQSSAHAHASDDDLGCSGSGCDKTGPEAVCRRLLRHPGDRSNHGTGSHGTPHNPIHHTGSSVSGCLLRYDGQLLSLALELGRRLLPAFDTPTGIPFHRIHLSSGQPDKTGSRETCTAAGGTFLLEFGLLSRLSGDPSFEAVARRAVSALWRRRSHATGLIGSTLDVLDGSWRAGHSGIGAGIDSFLEYLPKAAALLDDQTYASAWQSALAAVNKELVYFDTHLEAGLTEGRVAPKQPVVSSLQAFWPGLEVLAGTVADAAAHAIPLLSLWSKHGALPEAYDLPSKAPIHFAKDAPLRPELIESIYHLYTATRDPAYLLWTAQLVGSVHNRSRTDCGYASIADVTTGRLDNRMDSYFIAETTKYAFLTFDHALRNWGGAVMSREGVEPRDEGEGASGSRGGNEPLAPAAPSDSGELYPRFPSVSQWHSLWTQQCGCGGGDGETFDHEIDSVCDDDHSAHLNAVVECTAADSCSNTTDAEASEPSIHIPSPAVIAADSGSPSTAVLLDEATYNQPQQLLSVGSDNPVKLTTVSSSPACEAVSPSGGEGVTCTALPAESAPSPISPRRHCRSGGSASVPVPSAAPATAGSWCRVYCSSRREDDGLSSAGDSRTKQGSVAALSHPLAWLSESDVAASQSMVSAAEEAAAAVEEAGGSSDISTVASTTSPLSLSSLPLFSSSLIFTTEGHLLQITPSVQRPGRDYPLQWLGALSAVAEEGAEGGNASSKLAGAVNRTAYNCGCSSSSTAAYGPWPAPSPAAWSAPVASIPIASHVWQHGEGLPLWPPSSSSSSVAGNSRGKLYRTDAASEGDDGSAPLWWSPERHAPASCACVDSSGGHSPSPTVSPHPLLLLDPAHPTSTLPSSSSRGAQCLVSKLKGALPRQSIGSASSDDEAQQQQLQHSHSHSHSPRPDDASSPYLLSPYPSTGTASLYPSRLMRERPFDSEIGPAILSEVQQAQAQRAARQAQQMQQQQQQSAAAGPVPVPAAASSSSSQGQLDGTTLLQQMMMQRAHAQAGTASGDPGQAGLLAAMLQMQAAAAANALQQAQAALSAASDALSARARQLHASLSSSSSSSPGSGAGVMMKMRTFEGHTSGSGTSGDGSQGADGESVHTFTPHTAPVNLPPHLRWHLQQTVLTHALAVAEASAAAAGAANQRQPSQYHDQNKQVLVEVRDEATGDVRYEPQAPPPWVTSSPLPSWVSSALNGPAPDRQHNADGPTGGGLLQSSLVATLPRPAASQQGGGITVASLHLLLVANGSGLGHLVSPYSSHSGGSDPAQGAAAAAAAVAPPSTVEAAEASAPGSCPAEADSSSSALPLLPPPPPPASSFHYLSSQWTLTVSGAAPAFPPPFPSAPLASCLSSIPLIPTQVASITVHCEPLMGSCGTVTGPTDRQHHLAVHVSYEEEEVEGSESENGDGKPEKEVEPLRLLSCRISLPNSSGYVTPATGCVDDVTLSNAGSSSGDGNGPDLSPFRGTQQESLVAAAVRHTHTWHRHRHSHDPSSTTMGLTLPAAPAAFGPVVSGMGLSGLIPALASPLDGCVPIEQQHQSSSSPPPLQLHPATGAVASRRHV